MDKVQKDSFTWYKTSSPEALRLRLCRHYVARKLWYLPTGSHGVTNQRTKNDVSKLVRNSRGTNKTHSQRKQCYIKDRGTGRVTRDLCRTWESDGLEKIWIKRRSAGVIPTQFAKAARRPPTNKTTLHYCSFTYSVIIIKGISDNFRSF